MWIVREENHDALCVAENLGKAVMWLIDNQWLNEKTLGIKDDEEFLLKDILPKGESILSFIVKLHYKDGMKAVFEWLEQFGIYFSDIEVA